MALNKEKGDGAHLTKGPRAQRPWEGQAGLEGDVGGHLSTAPAWVEADGWGEPVSAAGHGARVPERRPGPAPQAPSSLCSQHPTGPENYVGVGCRRESRLQPDVLSFGTHGSLLWPPSLIALAYITPLLPPLLSALGAAQSTPAGV